MPMSVSFEERLYSNLPGLIRGHKTPFYVYDEQGIIETGEQLKAAFKGVHGFQEFFAVKANPNPTILEIMRRLGFGYDCSSIPELRMVRGPQDILHQTSPFYNDRRVSPDNIMFSSNNTSQREFEEAAADGGCILNLDDLTLVPKVPVFPELVSLRYNPGSDTKDYGLGSATKDYNLVFDLAGNEIIGKPEEAKYGVAQWQIVDAYRLARKHGAKRFGLHTMICSNQWDYNNMVKIVRMLLGVVRYVSDKLGIEKFEFINMGGGQGIVYHPDDEIPMTIEEMASLIKIELDKFEADRGYVPKFFMESGRYMTGPHGVVVAQVINQKHTYREYRGIDACMSSLMRPGIYGAYHHITVLDKNGKLKENCRLEVVDVVGSLCENSDKMAIQRLLPWMEEGDIVVIHDTGAHGYAMCFQYNARLRPAEFLLERNGKFRLIRRAERYGDYVRTVVDFDELVLNLTS